MAPSYSRPEVPPEIMDEIVDIVVASDITTSELSSLVQASRRCRHRIYTKRFSHITIHSQRPNRLKKLARLLDCCVWPPQDALQSYAKSLTLVLGIPQTNIPEIEFDIKKFEAISTILRRVFIHDQMEPYLGIHYSLIILTENPLQGPGDRGLQFDIMLGPIVTSTLEELCHKSCITELRLDNVSNVPPSLIYTSTIALLHLVDVHFKEKIGHKSDMAVLPRGNIQNLFLHNSESFPSPTSFFDAVWKYTERYSFQLRAKKFEIWVEEEEHLNTLSRLCGEIDTLIIHAAHFGSAYHGARAVNYSHAQILKSIEIIQDMRLCLRFVDSDAEEDEDWSLHLSPGTPTFLKIFHMLPPVLPPVLLVNMKIEITWCDPFANSREALDELYSALYDPSLIDYLQQSNLGENRRADFNLDITISLRQNDMDEKYGSRKQEYEDYVYHVLKSLVSINGVGVTSTVTFTVDP